MKNFFGNIFIDVIAIVFIAMISLWALVFIPILILSGLVLLLFSYYDFDNDKLVENGTALKIYESVMNALVLPYKLLGICDNFKEFCSWIGSNS